jgi:sec-independent protein translocase protein TatC
VLDPRLRRLRRLDPGEEVTLVEHLHELRNRLFVAIAALAVAFAFCFWQRTVILDALNRQLPVIKGHHILPATFAVSERFTIALQIAAYGAFLIALPVVFYQLYAYVMPAFGEGLPRRVWLMAAIVPLLFFAGVAFGYYIVLPAAMKFLLGFDANQYNTDILRASSYYSFAAMILAAMGLIFEMPAAVMVLTAAGVLSSGYMRRNRRYAIVILTIVAAALPGVDPISMLLELLPLLVLYEISIWLARLIEVRRARRREPPAVAAV